VSLRGARSGEQARLWTRNRYEISDRFLDIVSAATRQLPDGVVLDGVIWSSSAPMAG
jgi:ATP-dependent DNA ligase